MLRSIFKSFEKILVGYNYNKDTIITWYMLSNYYGPHVLSTLHILPNLIVLTTWCYMCDLIFFFYFIDRETETYQNFGLTSQDSIACKWHSWNSNWTTIDLMSTVKIVILYHLIYINFKFSKISIILEIFTLHFKNTSKVICGMLHIWERWGKVLGFGIRTLYK